MHTLGGARRLQAVRNRIEKGIHRSSCFGYYRSYQASLGKSLRTHRMRFYLSMMHCHFEPARLRAPVAPRSVLL